MEQVLINEDPLDAGALLSEFTNNFPAAGGIVNFSGQVRGENGQVKTLFLSRYEPLTTRHIEDAVDRTIRRFDLHGVCVRHRVGLMSAGETIVFCAAAAAHRRAAFDACDFLMDYLKTNAIFWKREDGLDGSKWIEPREQDYKDSQRWSPL